MAAPGRTLTVYLAADTSKAAAQLGTFQKGMSKLGAVAAGAAAGGLAIAGAAAVAFAADSVRAASDAEQAWGAVRSVFKGNAATIREWSRTSARELGLSAAAYQQLAATVGAQLRGMGLSLDSATTQTGKLVTIGADLAATFGGTTADAVAALGAALRGEYDSAEKFGVAIKQSDVNARLAEQGMAGLTGEALKQATAMATLQLITESTRDAQGAFAREQDTYAGATQRASAAIEDLKASIGRSLLPMLTRFVGYLVDEVLPQLQQWWAEHGRKVQRNIEGIASSLGSLVGGEGQDFTSWLDKVAGALDVVDKALRPVVNLWEKLTGWVSDADAALRDVFPAIGALTNPLKFLADYGAAAVEMFKNLGTWASNAASAVWDFISAIGSVPSGPISFPGVPRAASSAARSRSSSTRSTSSAGGVNVTIQAGVGDPVAIARAVQRVLDTRRYRLGVA